MSNDFTKMAKKVKKLPQSIEQTVDGEIGDEMGDMGKTARMNLQGNNSVATGRLVSHTRHRDDTASLDLSLDTQLGYSTHVVRADPPWSAYVEYGTGSKQGGTGPNGGILFPSPSSPPFYAIRAWMLAKGVTPQTGSIDDSAMAIATEISKYGNRAHPFMRPAWTEHRPALSLAHARGVRKALRRL